MASIGGGDRLVCNIDDLLRVDGAENGS